MYKIESLRVRAVRVPMAQPHRTASGVVTESPLVLTDVFGDDGVVGHSVVFTYTTMALNPTAELIRNVGELIRGEVLAPVEIEQKLSGRFRLLGTQGLVGVALAAIDMALWDALARGHRGSLVGLLGGVARPIPAYGAVGYDGVEASARAAADWAERGFKGVKAKIGYPTVQEDVADEDRRRDRLAPRGGDGPGGRRSPLQPSLARNQRATAFCDANRSLARVRRLVEPGPEPPPADQGRDGRRG